MDCFRIIEPVGTSTEDVEWVVAANGFISYGQAYDALSEFHSHARIELFVPGTGWVDVEGHR
jgi:transglutaminase-like putative cysteine protease